MSSDRSITNSIDASGTAIPLSICGVAEISAGIVAASIPAIRPLFLCVMTRLRGSSSKLPSSPPETPNQQYRYRARSNDDNEIDVKVHSMHERSDTVDQDVIVKTTEFKVTEAVESRADMKPGFFVGSALLVDSADSKV